MACRVRKVSISCCLGSLLLSLLFMAGCSAQDATWSMIDVQHGTQGDSHLIEFTDGQNILVDVGHRSNSPHLLRYLDSRGVKRINQVMITHAHKDHYGALSDLIRSNVIIDQVRFNLPNKAQCDAEKPWGCDWDEVNDLLSFITTNDIPIVPVTGNETVHKGGSMSLDVIALHDGISPPVGVTGINDATYVLMLNAAGTRVLLAADLNRRFGKWIADTLDIKSDILKAPHHGALGMPDDSFFGAVDPDVILIPAPARPWNSKKADHLYDYMERNDITYYNNGEHGNVLVEFASCRYKINGTVHKNEKCGFGTFWIDLLLLAE